MGFFDNLFNGSSDPRRSAQIRGGMLGAAQALLRPYSGFGDALTGAGMGAMQGKQDYITEQYHDLRNQQLQDEIKRTAAQKAALNNLFLGTKPAVTDTPAPINMAQRPAPAGDFGQNYETMPAQQQQPPQSQSRVPPGFESQEQFQAFAEAFPEEAAKRLFAAPELMSVGAGTHVIDKGTGKEVYTAPDKPNPNQPFNPDGSPNKAYQDYERAKMEAQQAPQWANYGLAKAKADRQGSGLIEPEVLIFMAQQALAGDKSVYTNIGRGAQGAENLAALRQEVMRQASARGLGGSDLAALNAEFAGLQAGERTLGNRTANIEMAANEARNLMPLVLEASARVPRTQYPSLNALLLAADQGTGGENVVTFGVAVNGLINTYARAISPTGVPTVSDKDHARELLSKAWSAGQVKAAVAQMDKEIVAAQKSPGQVRGAFRSAISGKDTGHAPYPDAASVKINPSDLPANAKMQLKAGVVTTFGNGSKWTLKNGKPVQVQ